MKKRLNPAEHGLRPIDFSCSCGQRLRAIVFSATAARPGEVRFYWRHHTGHAADPAVATTQRIHACPNCEQDFSRVTPEEFLDGVWPGG